MRRSDVAMTLDQIDLRLLQALQENNQLSAQALAERVPLSASAIQKRLRSYRQERIIEADVALLRPEAVGNFLFVLVMIQLEKHSGDAFEAFRTKLSESDRVINSFEISGSFDIACLCAFHNMADFVKYTDGCLAADPAVRRYECSFVKQRIKQGGALPLLHA